MLRYVSILAYEICGVLQNLLQSLCPPRCIDSISPQHLDGGPPFTKSPSVSYSFSYPTATFRLLLVACLISSSSSFPLTLRDIPYLLHPLNPREIPISLPFYRDYDVICTETIVLCPNLMYSTFSSRIHLKARSF